MLQELRGRIGGAEMDPMAFATALRDAALASNAQIHQYAVDHPELRGMGTTLTAAALRGDTLYIAQVGDSRAYLVRDGVAWQITKDQSLMQKLVEAGEITPEQAETSSRRNIILQALGPDTTVKIDVTHQPVRRGDVLLLCSDGLSGQVRGDEIARYAADEPDLSRLCATLVDRANETGGPDNITVIAARFEGPGVADSGHADEVGHRTFQLPPHPNDGNAPMDRAAQAFVEAAIARRTGGHKAVTRPEVAAQAAPPPLPPDELEDRRRRGALLRAALAALGAGIAAGLAWHYLL
jgi:protein phosphatase